ncbi:helix-turn-helix transcriptional regulator [Cellulomonas carbonis]|uniref:ArsR family transcriptional regulator n=1 Tax=Cellulomonas carbonis T26 TaxID=947969 RepID=A0A0A0BTK5_9CELL|nr:helix-turn-helix domain-containing protein [Cellulomonas carbonis]KGM11231.1 ArsR family transcriptional regulator [Cellulomonas carbonis T26]GGC10906.1 hypothetical protein GCM10010972_25330 [Cellulomonas carbonis]
MARRATDAYRVLSCESRQTILRLLQDHGAPMGVEDVAAGVGRHVNTVREHLDRMVGAGFLERSPEVRTTRGRPRMLYRALPVAPVTDPDQAVRDQLVRVLLAGYGTERGSRRPMAEEAGERWALDFPCTTAGHDDGTADSQMTALERHFRDLGFSPVLDRSARSLRLEHCPFADLVTEHGDVVCGVHLGLARGMLARHEGPLTVDSIGRRDGACEIRLRERQDVAAPRAAVAAATA